MSKVTLRLHVSGCPSLTASVELAADTPWEGVLDACRRALATESATNFRYMDDENDVIRVNSTPEWAEAVRLGTGPASNKTVHLEVDVPACCPGGGPCSPAAATPSSCSPASAGGDCCAPKTSCCGPTADTAPTAAAGCCDMASKSRDPKVAVGGGCCAPLATTVPAAAAAVPPPRIRNPNASSYQYKDEALRAYTMPLGPVGGGTIALAGDGGLRQWQVCNRVAHDAHVPDSFFAIRCGSGASAKAVVLQSSTWYDQSGFVPAPIVTDHVVPDASKQLLEDLPGVKTVEITSKFPIAEVDYTSGEVPAQVHTEAMSPTIALNSKDSGLPAIYFNFTVSNPTSAAMEVSLMTSLQNFAGWDGISPITNEVLNAGYGGNTNSLLKLPGMTAVDMCNPSLEADDPHNGHMAIGVLEQNGDTITTMLQYAAHNNLWQVFSHQDLPGQGSEGPSPDGKTWNTALACTRTIPAGGSTTFTFVLAWHYPNFYVNWSQEGFGIHDKVTKYFLGNQYANVWKNIEAVLEYATTNADQLQAQTRVFRDAMYANTTLPSQVVDSAGARMQVLKSPTAMWAADGNLYMAEGCSNSSICCPLNCSHEAYSQHAAIWPDLEATMRANDLDLQLSPNGILPSRSTVPIWLRRQWTFWPDYTQKSLDQSVCSDGEISTILKTYRQVLIGVSSSWFADAWHQCQKIMTRWMTVMDAQGDGVIRGAQPSTYDCPLWGANTFIGTYYLAALRAAEEMAKMEGNQPLAAQYHARFELASANYDKECFTNGQYYTQKVDPTHVIDVVSDGTWVDCLGGQWWAQLLGLGDLLPPEHVKSTIAAVFAANHVTSFDPSRQAPRKFCDNRDAGMYICTWGGPSKPAAPHALLYTSEAMWSGLAYPFASLAFMYGLTSIGMQVLDDVRSQYDGTRRSPANEIECGDFYSRSLSGVALIMTVSGQLWSEPAMSLQFGPRLTPSNFRGFFITNTGFGQYEQKSTGGDPFPAGTATLDVQYGTVSFTVLKLVSTATKASVTVGGQAVACTVAQQGGVLSMTFAKAVQIPTGSSLVATLSS